MKPSVLVTGATGFVGAELVRQLVEAGHEVDVLVRASSDRSLLAGLPVHWREGELDSLPALDDALARLVARGGESWVVHSAAVISYATRDAELQRRVNVEGTRNVLAACRRHRVTRVLHVSSVVAVGHALKSLFRLFIVTRVDCGKRFSTLDGSNATAVVAASASTAALVSARRPLLTGKVEGSAD